VRARSFGNTDPEQLVSASVAARSRLAIASSLVFAAVVLAPAGASAELRVRWDCYLPNASVDCALLETSLTSKVPFLKVVSGRGDADVAITLTSVPAESSTRFKCDLVGKRRDGYLTEVHTSDKIPSSIDPATATVRIMTKLERGLDDFMDQKVASEVENGVLTIRVMDPVRLPFAGRPEQSGVKWYVSPALGTYLSDVSGVGVNASGNASLAFNYSERSWRVQQSIGASYSRQSQPVPGTGETASVSFAGGTASNVISRSLTSDDRWSVGLLMAAEKNPQANYTMRANGSVGLEFDLVPRQTVNQRNFGFRCAIGPELEHYDATNIEGLGEQAVGRQFCDLFLSWHLPEVDVWAALSETTILDDFDYRSVSGSVSATWRLTDNFTFSPWVGVQQINKAINQAEPSNVTYADPRQEIEASLLSAAQGAYTAPFGVQSGLSLRYLFGNGSLSLEDQRWRGASNLR
jgi:hypothetical protein